MIALSLLALLAAALLWRWSAREQAATGLPRARLLAQDTEPGRALDGPLLSHHHRLVGRPDYVIEQAGALVPVEVKPGRRARAPYDGDLLQLAAYCLLVEETSGRPPPHGILRYADRSWVLPWDEAARASLLAALAALRRDRVALDLHRSHEEPARCAACGLRGACDERLA